MVCIEKIITAMRRFECLTDILQENRGKIRNQTAVYKNCTGVKKKFLPITFWLMA